MAKLSPVYEFKKDGTRIVKGYRIALKKTECEKYGFDSSTEVKIEYSDKIIIKRGETK